MAKGLLKYIICLLGLAVFLSGGVVPSFADTCRNANKDFVKNDDGDDDDDDDDDGSHHAGMNCLTGGCHTGGEHRFTIGGTIYSDINGTAARAGAQITVTGSNNQKTVLTSDQIGNFHSSQSIPAPYTITASYLGREVKMPATAATGGCNDNSCHVVGNGAAGRMFISTVDQDLTGTITEASGNSGISYNGTIKAILDAKCISCHKAGGSKSDVPLTTYDEVTIPRLVTAGSKDSLLLKKVDKQSSLGTMWPNLRSAREYNQIKDWIVKYNAQDDSISGGVVSGATIQLTQGGQVKYSTTTSQTGAFVLKSVMAGAYSVRISKKGYKTYTQPYQMNQINVPPLNVAIKKK